MALPVTISGVQWPEGPSDIGPFTSRSGNVYFFNVTSADLGTLGAWKATDPTSSFSAAGTVDIGGTTFSIYAISAKIRSNTVHIAIATHDGNLDGEVHYVTYNLSTDSFGTPETITTWSGSFSSQWVTVSIEVRTDTTNGEVIVMYNGDSANVHGQPFQRVYYARRSTGGTWTVDVSLDNAGADNWVGGCVVRGSVDRMHFAFTNDDTGGVFCRTLNSSNSLETFPSSIATTTSAGQRRQILVGRAYDDNGTVRVRIPYNASGGFDLIEFNSDSDTPTYGNNTSVGGNAPYLHFSSYIGSFANDGKTLQLVYSDNSTQDLWHDKGDGGFTWSTDTELLDATTVERLSCNVYDRGGTKLGILYRLSGATTRYDESDRSGLTNQVDLNQALVSLTSGEYPDQNSQIAPINVDQSNSDRYIITTDRDRTKVAALKATASIPTNLQWSSQDNNIHLWTGAADVVTSGNGRAGGPNTQDYVRSIFTTVHSSDIYVTTQQDSGRVALHIYDPGTDTWTTRDETIALAGDTNFDNAPARPAVTHAVRSDGDVVIVASYNDGTNERLRVFTREGSTITNRGVADGGVASTDYGNPIAVGPNSGDDRIGWAYLDLTNDDLDTISISSANSISSATEIDAAVDTSNFVAGPGVIDDNDVAYVPYVDVDNQISIASWSLVASPTPSVETTVSQFTVANNGATAVPYPVLCLAIDGLDVYLMYSDASTTDLYKDDNRGGAFHSTDTEVVDAVTVSRLGCRVNGFNLDFTYLNAGGIFFGTFPISAGPGGASTLGIGL